MEKEPQQSCRFCGNPSHFGVGDVCDDCHSEGFDDPDFERGFIEVARKMQGKPPQEKNE